MTAAIIERYETVKTHIQKACEKYSRAPESVQLLAVSKTKPIEDIRILAEQGQRAFGENYVQEMALKQEDMPYLEWHFIGPLQSNKTKTVAETADWMHSVDRIKIAQRLSQQRPAEKKPLQILLQVNVNNEASKSGFTFDELAAALTEIQALPNLNIRGLMAIPEATSDEKRQRENFAQVRIALEALQTQFPTLNLDTLSMGMSNDLEAAIAEGATMVRIGTDIFGSRNIY